MEMRTLTVLKFQEMEGKQHRVFVIFTRQTNRSVNLLSSSKVRCFFQSKYTRISFACLLTGLGYLCCPI